MFVERKTHRESWTGEESVKERFALPHELVVPYLTGRHTWAAEEARLTSADSAPAATAATAPPASAAPTFAAPADTPAAPATMGFIGDLINAMEEDNGQAPARDAVDSSRPKNAYQCFMQVAKPKINMSNPEAKYPEICKLLGRARTRRDWSDKIRSGHRYGRMTWEIEYEWDIGKGIDMGYMLSMWDMVYRYGHSPYRHGHRGCRYGIRANDMGDVSIDMVILHIDLSRWDILSLCSDCALIMMGPLTVCSW